MERQGRGTPNESPKSRAQTPTPRLSVYPPLIFLPSRHPSFRVGLSPNKHPTLSSGFFLFLDHPMNSSDELVERELETRGNRSEAHSRSRRGLGPAPRSTAPSSPAPPSPSSARALPRWGGTPTTTPASS